MPVNPSFLATPPTPADAQAIRYYYLRNFQFALAWLGERYGDLLEAQEVAFLAGFGALPQASQALLVRMLMRKGPVFRSSALVYEEIGCPLAASRPLVQAGWVDDDPILAFDDAVRLLRRAEVVALLAAQAAGKGNAGSASKGWTKARMVEALRLHDPQPAPWRRWRGDSDDVLLDVRVAPLVERLRLMFFGNLRQEWSEFVLADLGIFQYERVQFERSSRAFDKRSDVDAYLRLHALRQRFDDGAQAAQLLPEAMREECATAWVNRRRDKLLFGIGRQLEREQRWDEALQAYDAGAHAQARHRAMRVMELRGQHDAALAAALKAVAAPRDDAEAQLLQRLVRRLQRALGHTAPRAKAAPGVPVIVLDVHKAATPQRVELLARAHLAQAHAPVFYVENTLVNSLFGLLCWQALFQPLPGAFFHPFQRGPADLHFPEFVPMRAAAFDACLARLDDGSHCDAIRANYRDKAGLQSPFVYWDTIDEALLDMALHCVPAAHLKLWFRRILADIRANGSGLPDLVQFWPAEQRYELIEVKGPGDRLQDNQRRWMAYNTAHGIPVKVCHVRWAEQAQ
jgi:hypothetical protein